MVKLGISGIESASLTWRTNMLLTTHDAKGDTEQSHVSKVERRLKEPIHPTVHIINRSTSMNNPQQLYAIKY